MELPTEILMPVFSFPSKDKEKLRFNFSFKILSIFFIFSSSLEAKLKLTYFEDKEPSATHSPSNQAKSSSIFILFTIFCFPFTCLTNLAFLKFFAFERVCIFPSQ